MKCKTYLQYQCFLYDVDILIHPTSSTAKTHPTNSAALETCLSFGRVANSLSFLHLSFWHATRTKTHWHGCDTRVVDGQIIKFYSQRKKIHNPTCPRHSQPPPNHYNSQETSTSLTNCLSESFCDSGMCRPWLASVTVGVDLLVNW